MLADACWSLFDQFGISKKDVRPALQPIVDRYGVVAAHEVLFRRRDGQPIMTEELMESMEARGMIHELDLVMLKTALDTVRNYPLDARLAVNLSGLTIDRYSPELRAVFIDAGRSGRQIIVEITETHRVRDESVLRRFANFARSSGVMIALDDCFAIGSVNGAQAIKTIRPDIVKLDGSIVVRSCDNDMESARTRNMVRSLHDLGIQVVAEKIETQQQYDQIFDELECDYGQGYYIGRPKQISIPPRVETPTGLFALGAQI